MEAFKAPIRHFNCILSRCHFVYGELRDPVVGSGGGGGDTPGDESAATDGAEADSFDVAFALWLCVSDRRTMLMLCKGLLSEDGVVLYLALVASSFT